MAQRVLLKFLLQLVVVLVVVVGLTNGGRLKIGYYKKNCPNVEAIVRRTTAQVISRASTLAAPLLRLHFHDCFVRGCDGSVLINSTMNNQAEKDALPNRSLRGFHVIDLVKAAVEEVCPGEVSCADILALVARDATYLIGGPFWEVPTGRRDGRVSTSKEALLNLPPATMNITQLKTSFRQNGLSVKDLVVLSGGHTIGISHCLAFANRIYNFTGKGDTDPTLDPNYIIKLRKKCKPDANITTIVEMDPGSFKTFDTSYYELVTKRRGLFQSDAALLDDEETMTYIDCQLKSDKPSFFHDFGVSMVKMGNIGVLTGKKGEIRKHCAVINS